MNIVTQKLIAAFGPMLLKSIINSMLEEKTLTEYKDKVLAFLRRQADKSKTEIDDAVIESVIKMIMTPGLHVEYTKDLCQMFRQYITHSENEWDDIAFLPIIDRIETIGTAK